VGVRRARVALGAGVAASVIILIAWFPFSALSAQRSALNATSSQLAQLKSQDQALKAEQQRLGTTQEVTNVARQQYQLATPGQQAYQVLLPPSATSPGRTSSPPFPGDPGIQPLAPTAGATSGAGSSTNSTAAPPASSASKSGTAPSSRASGFFQRIFQNLEFWR
jgi:cell division protein FtsB